MVVTLLPAALAAQRQIDPDCALADGRFRVELVHEGVCCPKELLFLVQGREESVARELRVESRLGKIYTVRLFADSYLVTTGSRHRGGHVILVKDLLDDRAPLEIWSYVHHFSPSRRRLLYSTFYELDAPLDERRSILALFDFAAHRERETEVTGSAQSGVPEEPAHHAGIPIYPPINARQGSFDPSLDDPHILQSPILWSEDEDRVVFLESFRGESWLVEVVVAEESVVLRRRFGAAELGSARSADTGPPIAVELRWRSESDVEASFSARGAEGWRTLSLPGRRNRL